MGSPSWSSWRVHGPLRPGRRRRPGVGRARRGGPKGNWVIDLRCAGHCLSSKSVTLTLNLILTRTVIPTQTGPFCPTTLALVELTIQI